MDKREYKKHPNKQILDSFSQLCRDSVRQQIANFKASKVHANGYYYSDLTGYKITNHKKAQCNHVKPFRELLYEFIKLENIDLLTVFEKSKAELDYILRKFSAYHEKHAVLNILTEYQNKQDFYKNRNKFRKWQEFYTKNP